MDNLNNTNNTNKTIKPKKKYDSYNIYNNNIFRLFFLNKKNLNEKNDKNENLNFIMEKRPNEKQKKINKKTTMKKYLLISKFKLEKKNIKNNRNLLKILVSFLLILSIFLTLLTK
jgi:hypothetical protein